MRIRQEQKAAVRAGLLKAGVDLIARKGFAAVTIEEITAEAGVAKGTFYNYFPTKESLAIVAAAGAQAEGAEGLEQLIAALPHTSERIQMMFARATQWIEGNPELTWIWCLEQLRHPDPDRSHHFRDALRAVLEAGQALGQVRSPRSSAALTMDLEGILFAHVAAWYHGGARAGLMDSLGPAIDTYLSGALIPEPAGTEETHHAK